VAVSPTEAVDVAERFFAALQRGDVQGATALFADGAVVWHNWDQLEQTPSEALAPVAALAPLQPRLELVRRYVVSDGCVQQHVIRLTAPSGAPVEIPAIQRICIEAGKITRIDEYMDTNAFAAVFGADADRLS
jgi:ketosteroid isomerase-like protein